MAVSVAPISELRHRITFETLTLTGDGQGGSVETWVEYATVWASVVPLKKPERLFSEQLQTQRTHEIIIRWMAGLTTAMRISYEGRIFQIKGFRLPDERRFFIKIDAEENQGT